MARSAALETPFFAASLTPQPIRLPIVHEVLHSPGEPLPDSVKAGLEPLMGRSLEGVRVHVDRRSALAARTLRASAFTVGSHIVFAAGRYEPASARGRRLLAHELAHVLQQDDTGVPDHLWSGAPPGLEEEADHIASRVVAGLRAGPASRPPLPGLVQMHISDVPCPSGPGWREIPADPQEIWLGANRAIEIAYGSEFGTDGVLFGSDYKRYKGEFRHEIQLPRGLDRKQFAFARTLLRELRGIKYQNQPDIVDFRKRAFYEIKTSYIAGLYRKEVEEQLADLYRKAQAISIAHSGTRREPIGNWDPINATWYPPHLLPFAGDPDKIVCTAATDYTRSMPGLILYDVREAVTRRRRSRQRRQVRAFWVDLGDFAREFEQFIPMMKDGIMRSAQEYEIERPERVVIVPSDFYRQWTRQWTLDQIDKMRVKLPPFLDKRHPVGQFRALGWRTVFVTGGAMLGFSVIASSAAIGGAVAAGMAAGGASVGTAGATGGGAIISLAAYAALRAAPTAQRLSKAAGVLLVLGTGTSDAEASQVALTSVRVAARAVPVADFFIDGPTPSAASTTDPGAPYLYDAESTKAYFGLRQKVMFDGEEHYIIGTILPHN